MVRHSRAKSTGKAHQNIDRRCENVLKAALLSHFDEPSQAPHGPSPKLHGAAPSSSGPNCPCRLCVSIKATEATIFSNNHQ